VFIHDVLRNELFVIDFVRHTSHTRYRSFNQTFVRRKKISRRTKAHYFLEVD